MRKRIKPIARCDEADTVTSSGGGVGCGFAPGGRASKSDKGVQEEVAADGKMEALALAAARDRP